ncbi:MAG: hypothetical protein CSA75_01710 [Sorangium cellulosum]|nr:MAG: hypothetical protein CSA75_01710 [Sorangium cellulosum]
MKPVDVAILVGHCYRAMTTADTSSKDSHPHDEQLPEEPKTPLWMTALGVALLVGAGVGYLFVDESTEESERVEAASESKAKTEDATPQEAAAKPPSKGSKRAVPGLASGRASP